VTDPRTARLDDPRALRAYAHPTRMALVALLRAHGPMTATDAASHVGESPSSCSFHLRQLAKYGLVEEAPGGRGRQRPWQATAMLSTWDDASDPAGSEALDRAVATGYQQLMARWIRDRADEPPAWQHAAAFGDVLVHLTADELATVTAGMRAVLEPYLDRLDDPAQRPADARPVTVLQVAIPVP
jgi:predicted ArsR family transcriptional regulator